MALFKIESDVTELSHTATQGWLYRDNLSARIKGGWRVVGVCSDHPQHLTLLLTRRRWFWQRKPK
jgi:hypothetical protein